MRLLKQETPFMWDETALLAFKALKRDLLSDPLLRPPNYSKDFILYLVASESTIGVVFVQENNKLQEHVVYYLRYLSCALASPELRYSHFNKLASTVVYGVQRLLHYILLRTTTMVEDVNPF